MGTSERGISIGHIQREIENQAIESGLTLQAATRFGAFATDALLTHLASDPCYIKTHEPEKGTQRRQNLKEQDNYIFVPARRDSAWCHRTGTF